MQDFSTLFASQFTDPARSLANTFAGFDNFSIRLAANLPNAGLLAPLFVNLHGQVQAVAVSVRAAQQTMGLTLGAQKLAREHTAEAKAKALDRVRKNEGSLKGDLLIEDPEVRANVYALLYPTGKLSYYTEADLRTELADRLGEYLAITEEKADLLGDAFVTKVQNDLGPFRTVRENQTVDMSKTIRAREDRHELVPICDELCDYAKSLLSAHYRLNLGAVANYWNPVFYIKATPRTAPATRSNLAVQPNQHRYLFDLSQFAALTTLTITLRTGGPLCLARCATATAPLPASVLDVPTGTAGLAIQLSTLPGSGDFVVAYNESGHAVHLDAALS